MITLIPNGTPLVEFNKAHDRLGRFASTGGGGTQHEAPDMRSGRGGGAHGVQGRPTHADSARAHDKAATANAHAAKHPNDPSARLAALKATDRALAHTQMTSHTPQTAHEAANSAYYLARNGAEGHAAAAGNHAAVAAAHRAADTQLAAYNQRRMASYKAAAAALPVGHSRGPAHPATHGADRFFPWLRPSKNPPIGHIKM